MTISSLCALAVAMAIPFTPAGAWFGFEAPPPLMLLGLGLVVVTYLACAEQLKRFAIGRLGRAPRLAIGSRGGA